MKAINKKTGISNLRTIIIFLFIMLIIGIAGQENNQSNIDVGDQPLPNETYIDSLNKIAFSVFRTNPAKTRDIALKTLALSKSIEYPTGRGKASNYIAMSYHLSGSFDTAYQYYQKALGVFQADNDTLNTGKIFNNLALLFTHREYYKLALEYNLKSLELAEQMKDKEGKFHSLNNIGITYEKLGQYNKARDSYNSSLELIKSESDTKKLYYYALSNIGIINLLTQKYDSAESQINKGLAYFLSLDDNYGISQSYRYLGELFIETAKYKKAMAALNKSDEYAAKTKDKKLQIDNQFLMARLHFAKNEFALAKIAFTQALKNAQDANFANTIIQSYSYISKIDSIQGNYFDALKNFQASLSIKDSLNSLKIQNQIAQFSIQYETLQKDQEIARLLQSEEVKELKINKHLAQKKLFFVILLAVAIILIFGLYTQRKIKKKNTLLTAQNDEIAIKNAELRMHQNQLEELVTKRTSELILARDKALESDRLKSAFLLNISHEIRTPMNGILGFTELLTQTGLSDDVQQKYLIKVKDSCRRLLNTVTDLIEISKIETHQLELYNEKIHLAAEVNSIIDDFKPEITKKGLGITFSNRLPEKQIYFFNDKSKLIYIITNLIKNAIKYTPSGTIQIVTEKRQHQMLLWVKDTGIGIPPQRLQAIFKHFEQADIEDSHAMQGSGLGLTISKAYIELMGGKIWVKSEVDNGSTFFIAIPDMSAVTKAQITEATKNINELITDKQLKILIIEDDETSKTHLNIILDRFAREFILTRNGSEAVDLCRQNPDIDLILMDIKMPDMDGYTTTREIRKFNKEVKIIAQTAYALAGDRENALDSGCNDYVAKPVNKDELFRIIQKLFN